MVNLIDLPDEVKACVIEFTGTKDKFSLPWGVTKVGSGKYQPFIAFPRKHIYMLPETFDDPYECHKFFQLAFIKFATDTLDKYPYHELPTESYKHQVGKYIAEQVINKVYQDVEAERETY